MDTDTTDIDLSELTSDFAPSDGTEAAGESGGAQETGTTGEGAGSTGTEVQNVAQGSGDNGQQAEAPLDLARLQALAEKRRAERPAAKQEPEERSSAEPLTAEAIAKAVREGDSYRDQLRKALQNADLEALARLATDDPSKVDPASLYERFTRAALDPDGAQASAKIAKLEAELAELRGQKLPDDVLTTSKYEEMQQQAQYAKAKADSEQAFRDLVSGDADAHPILSKIDSKLAMDYAYHAQGLLEAHAKETGSAFTLQDVSRIAEEIASSSLGGLVGQNRGPASETEGGSDITKAASAATAGKTEVSGEIDNRAASTTSATMPDPDDEEAWERRLDAIAAGSRAQ